MISAELLPLVAITVMLWILWSDSVRTKRTHRAFYFLRAFLFAAASGVVIYDLIAYPELFGSGAKAMAVFAVIVGTGGTFYFFRKGLQKVS